jgi:hypothetical protein
MSHLPILVDPSHSTGKRNKVLPMSRAAIAVGADGVLIESPPQAGRSVVGRTAGDSPRDVRATRARGRRDRAQVLGRTLQPALAASLNLRRTKIIATLGPACNTEDTIQRLLTSGVDVFRLNFSHGTAEERTRLIEIIRRTATDIGEVRADRATSGAEAAHRGSRRRHSTPERRDARDHDRSGPGNTTTMVSTPFTHLPQEVQLGHRIMINDGLVEVVVTAIDDKHVTTCCTAVRSHRGRG